MTDIVFVLNGPNLNLLGTREPDIYGYDTLDDIAGRMEDAANRAHVEIDFRQCNHEGHLVDWLQEAHAEGAHALIINPGAYTHTSVALRDAIASVKTPAIEVHISNILTREEFRKKSFLSDVCKGIISGLGLKGYEFAIDYFLSQK